MFLRVMPSEGGAPFTNQEDTMISHQTSLFDNEETAEPSKESPAPIAEFQGEVPVSLADALEAAPAVAPATRRTPRRVKVAKKTAAKRTKKAPKAPARCGPECRRAAACMKEAHRLTKIRMEKAGRESWNRSDELFCERTYRRLLAERSV
jgi:hypothetical protein